MSEPKTPHKNRRYLADVAQFTTRVAPAGPIDAVL